MPISAVTPQPDRLGSTSARYAADRPGRLQLADPLVHGRRGQPDLAGQFGVRRVGRWPAADR